MPTQINFSFQKILTGSDLSERRLPVMIAQSKTPGPVIWLTACSHGDEVGGIVVIQEIFKLLKKENLLERGTIFALPLMNPLGFEMVSHTIAFSEEDLNRYFPGNQNGSLAERIAQKIFSLIARSQPSLVLDLHNDWIRSLPYTLIDPCPGPSFQKTYQKAKKIAQESGFLIVEDTKDFQHTLSYSLIKKHIPALTLELGESYVINEKDIVKGVNSLKNILAYFGMINPQKHFIHSRASAYQGKILKYFDRPSASSSGILRFLAKPGMMVKRGQPIAKIDNAFGQLQETILALREGVVLGHPDSSAAFPGSPVMAFAVLEEK